jgi:hypothetical protein
VTLTASQRRALPQIFTNTGCFILKHCISAYFYSGSKSLIGPEKSSTDHTAYIARDIAVFGSIDMQKIESAKDYARAVIANGGLLLFFIYHLIGAHNLELYVFAGVVLFAVVFCAASEKLVSQ